MSSVSGVTRPSEWVKGCRVPAYTRFAPLLRASSTSDLPMPRLAPVTRTALFAMIITVSSSVDGPPHAQGRNLTAAGSDDERSQGGRHVPNHAPTVPSSVLDQDISGREHHLRAIVELKCHVAREKDPEIRRVSPVKAVVSSAGFVAILELHPGSG